MPIPSAGSTFNTSSPRLSRMCTILLSLHSFIYPHRHPLYPTPDSYHSVTCPLSEKIATCTWIVKETLWQAWADRGRRSALDRLHDYHVFLKHDERAMESTDVDTTLTTLTHAALREINDHRTFPRTQSHKSDSSCVRTAAS